MTPRTRTWIKVAVSASVLAFISVRVDLTDVGRRVLGLDPSFVAAAFGIYLAGQIASSVRYVYILQALRRSLSVVASVRLHYMGLWFNQVMPTSLGGDVVKVLYLRHHVGLSRAVRATLLDRISGLAILMAGIVVLAPAYWRRLPSLAIPVVVLSAAFLAALVIGPIVARRPGFRRLLPRVMRPAFLLPADVTRFGRARHFWPQFWSSGAVHACGVLTYAMLGMALGLPLVLIEYFLLVPLVFLFALLPISFAGWGLRETGAVGLFGIAGIPAEPALLLSVLFGMLQLASAVPGGIDWALHRDLPIPIRQTPL